MPGAGTYPTADPAVGDYTLGPTAAGAVKRFPAPEPLGRVLAINEQTDNYTLALTDAGKIVEMNKATAVNLTVPANASVAFPVLSRIDVVQIGAGQVTFVAAGGVTIRSKGSILTIAGQNAGASLYKRATNEWVLLGDLG